MNRRNFLGIGFAGFAASLFSTNLNAVNFRDKTPKLWTASKVDLAMQELFGTSEATMGQIKLKAPDIAENGAVIPITIKTKLKASKVAIFQDSNPESTVAVFQVPENGIIEYSVRIKMAKTGTVTVVASVDGKLYKAQKLVKVTIGGCGG